MRHLKLFYRILFSYQSTWKLISFTVLSFSFSISVILSTIGLMDGFEKSLRDGLRSASGDVIVTSLNGFYQKEIFPQALQGKNADITHLLELESFALYENESKGIILRGVNPASFEKVTNLNTVSQKGEIVVGKEILKLWKMKVGQQMSVVLSSGHPSLKKMPVIKTFTLRGTVEHGIYEKDARFAYVHLEDLYPILAEQEIYNLSLLKLNQVSIEDWLSRLPEDLDALWRIKPYWREFSSLIQAVDIEKFSISLILQLIVIVAIFNLAAMVIYISEKKAQDFFLIQALGVDKKYLLVFWSSFFGLIWVVSCVIAHYLSLLFNFLLQNSSWLKIPGDIYVINGLSLDLGIEDYALTFGLSFAWIILVTFIVCLKIKNRPILKGLRMEYM